MWLLHFLVGVPTIGVVVVVLLTRMPSKRTSLGVKVDVGVAWVAALSVVLLAPADIAETLSSDPPAGASGETTFTRRFLAVSWQVAYWYAFAAMMTVLPFHQELADCGEFKTKDKVLYSLRRNATAAAAMLAAALFGALTLLASHKLSAGGLVGFAVAASNAFGLMIVLFLMGHGLVEIPRAMWRKASGESRRRLLLHKVGTQAAVAQKAHGRLAECAATVAEVSKVFSRRDPLRKYMDVVEQEMQDRAANEGVTIGEDAQIQRRVARGDDLEFEYCDVHEIAALRLKLHQSFDSYAREKSRCDALIRQAARAEEDAGVGVGYQGTGAGSTRHARTFSHFEEEEVNLFPAGSGDLRLDWGQLVAKVRTWGATHGRQAMYYLASIKLALLSLCVVLSQCVIYEGLPLWLKSASPLRVVVYRMAGLSGFAVQFTCLLMLGYLMTACWYSLFQLRLFSFYVMVPRHTPSASLLMNAMVMCRLAAPLAFNFMMIVMPPTSDQETDVRQTVFYAEFGEKMLDLSYLGAFLGSASLTFTSFAPTVMVPYMIVLLLNKCSAFTAVAARCGCMSDLNFDDDNWEGGEGTIEVGKRLVARYRETGVVRGGGGSTDSLLSRLLEQETLDSAGRTRNEALGSKVARWFSFGSNRWKGTDEDSSIPSVPVSRNPPKPAPVSVPGAEKTPPRWNKLSDKLDDMFNF